MYIYIYTHVHTHSLSKYVSGASGVGSVAHICTYKYIHVYFIHNCMYIHTHTCINAHSLSKYESGASGVGSVAHRRPPHLSPSAKTTSTKDAGSKGTSQPGMCVYVCMYVCMYVYLTPSCTYVCIYILSMYVFISYLQNYVDNRCRIKGN